MGYHKTQIQKGIIGEASKMEEELAELNDAMAQGNRVMALVELSDLCGAISLYLKRHFPDFTIHDLLIMAEATSSAFEDGTRT